MHYVRSYVSLMIAGVRRPLTLGYAGTYGDGRLDASLEWRSVYDNLVFPSLSPIWVIASSFGFSDTAVNGCPFHVFSKAIKSMRICGDLSSMYYARNSCAESLRLPPSAIRQGRVVWSRGGQVPLRVCSIESCTMPASTLANHSFTILCDWLKCLAMMTTAGGRPILDGLGSSSQEVGSVNGKE